MIGPRVSSSPEQKRARLDRQGLWAAMRQALRLNPVLLILSALGAAMVLVATSGHGAGLTPDAVGYVTVARSLLAGKGCVDWTGEPFVQQPPLFSLALASIGWLAHADPRSVAPFFNAVVFGAIIYTAGIWLIKNVRTQITALLGCMAIAVSLPLFRAAAIAWTEPLFILLCLLFLHNIGTFLEEPNRKSLYLAAGFVGLAWITRYVGVTLVLTGILLLLTQRRRTFAGRLTDGLRFVALAILPAMIWSIRNFLVSSTFAGGRAPSSTDLLTNASLAFGVLRDWFWHAGLPGLPGLLTASLMLAFVGFFARTAPSGRSMSADEGNEKLWRLLPPVCFAVVYTGFLILLTTAIAIDTIDSRLLLPVYVPLVCAFLGAVDHLVALVQAPHLRRSAHALFQTALLIGLAYPVQATSTFARYCRQTGWGYAWVGWADSPMIAYLKEHPLPGQTVSNDPWGTDILTGIPAGAAPEKYYYNSPKRDPESLPRFQRKLESGQPTYLVWFQGCPLSYFYPVEELRSLLHLTPLAQFPEGTIYQVQAPDTPEMHLNASLVHYQQQRYDDCIRAAKAALRLKPDYAEAYNNLAAAYQSMRRWDEAITAANEALRLKPDFSLARNNLNYALSQKAQTASAAAKPQKAASNLQPTSAGRRTPGQRA